MLLAQCKKPKNESNIHYELKQIAKYILKNKGCSIIGEEVMAGKSQYLPVNYKNTFNKNAVDKSIIDVIGLKLKGTYWYRENYISKPIFQCIGIEAKATLEDFKNGFCCRADRTYVIAPKNVIPIELIPKNIGLIEVDLNNYKISDTRDGFVFLNIEEIVQAKSRIDACFIDTITKYKDNINYQIWCEDMMRTIGYRLTNDDLYKNNKILIHSKKWNGNVIGV